MYFIVVGGGRLGVFLSKRLVHEKHTVVLIEKNDEVCAEATIELGTMVICGDGCEPTILEQAGAERADVLVAVTGSDEENFVACQIAKERFKVNRTIARVNDPENERAFNELGIDVSVGATVILGKIIEEEASFSDAMDLFSFGRGKLKLVRVDLPEDSPVIHKKLSDLQLPPSSVLVSIMRGNEIIIPKGDTQLLPLDNVIALTLIEYRQQLIKYLVGDNL